MSVGAARRRHDNPAAIDGHEVADEVVREVVATLFGHGGVVPRATDRLSAKLIQPCLASLANGLTGLANGLRCVHISAQVAALQMGDVGLSFIDVSPQ